MKKPKRMFKERRVSGRVPAPVELRKTAFHEAGHAVSAIVLGLELRSVDIKLRQHPDGGISLGTTNCPGIANADLLGQSDAIPSQLPAQLGEDARCLRASPPNDLSP